MHSLSKFRTKWLKSVVVIRVDEVIGENGEDSTAARVLCSVYAQFALTTKSVVSREMFTNCKTVHTQSSHSLRLFCFIYICIISC